MMQQLDGAPTDGQMMSFFPASVYQLYEKAPYMWLFTDKVRGSEN